MTTIINIPGWDTLNTSRPDLNTNFANLNADKLEDAPSDSKFYTRKDWGWEETPVSSVNTQTWDVVLNADDIDDASTTHKFATQAELDLANSALQNWDNVSELTNDVNYIDAAGAPVQSVNWKSWTVSLNIDDLSDVDTSTTPPTTWDRLIWDGSNWVPDEIIFGTQYNYIQQVDSTPVINSTTSYVNVLTLTTWDLPAGTYSVQISYLCNHANNGNDFVWRVTVDAIEKEEHRYEPKDSGWNWNGTWSNQRQGYAVTFDEAFTWVTTIWVDVASDNNWTNSAIWNCRIRLFRVA